MGGKHLMTIITDQDKAMKAAIQLVFRNTRQTKDSMKTFDVN
jgi:hypothetical protein